MPRRKPTDSKTDALIRQGALNRRPDAVRDDIFASSDFFDRRDLVQVRYEMLRRVRVEGGSVAETAKRFGVSRPTYYKLDADFGRSGLSGLLPQKRGPKGGHKLTAEALSAVTAELEANPSTPLASLNALLRRRFRVAVHDRTIARALAREKKKDR
jgi:transposase